MRKQPRGPEPEALIAKKAEGTANWKQRRDKWRAAIAAGEKIRSPQFAWPDWKNESLYVHLIPVLRNQSEEHCSFCDGYPVQGVSLETIEHFCPKTGDEFEDLVLEWKNLFYCCNCCQLAKASDFHPALLKPDAEDYDFDRYFRFDFGNGEILPSAAEASSDYVRAFETIRLYGLNEHGRPRRRLNAWLRFERDPEKIIADMPYRDFLERGKSA